MMLDVLTISVMVVGSVFVWRREPLKALTLYFWIILLYPEGWTVKFGNFPELFPAKVVVLPLVLTLILKAKRLRTFRPNVLDAAVILLLAGKSLATLTHGSLMETAAHLSHDFTTQTLVYFSVRLAVTSRKDVYFFIRSLSLAGVVLAVIVIYEALSGDFVYDRLHRAMTGTGWETLGLTIRQVQPRMGIYRPIASFAVHISIGLFFAGMLPLLFSLRKDRAWRTGVKILVASLLAVGTLATVSSGPLFCIAVTLAVLACYPVRRTLPFAVPLIIGMLVFWQVLAPSIGLMAPLTSHLREFAYVPENADYRLGLVREAFSGGMQGHWFFGYGYNAGIGVENPNPAFNWEHEDIVNIHIAHLVRFGLFGALPFLFVILISFLKLAQAGLRRSAYGDSWWLWCWLAFFLGWQVAFMTVSSIYQVTILLYAFVGIMAGLPDIAAVPEDEEEDSEVDVARATVPTGMKGDPVG